MTMSHIPRTPRAQEQRLALGRRIRAYRLALGLTNRDIAAHIGASNAVMTSIEAASRDVYVGTLIDVANAVGLDVALVAEHHLPLLELDADEVDQVLTAAHATAATTSSPRLLAALAKTTA